MASWLALSPLQFRQLTSAVCQSHSRIVLREGTMRGLQLSAHSGCHGPSCASTTAFAQFSALYKFGTNNGDPCDATNSGIVAQGRDGNLYSTAPWCGAYGYGAVFKITPAGALTVLYSFGGKNGDGLNPRGGLTLGTDGNFYGTTAYGGTNLYGTVFKITSSGKLTILYNFSNGSDGGVPFAAPVQSVDGNFYGTTCQCDGQNGPGTIYKITPSGKFTSLYQLDFWAS